MQLPSANLELVIITSPVKKEDGKIFQENIERASCAKNKILAMNFITCQIVLSLQMPVKVFYLRNLCDVQTSYNLIISCFVKSSHV